MLLLGYTVPSFPPEIDGLTHSFVLFITLLNSFHAYGEHMPGPSPRREGNDEGGPWCSPIDLEFPSLLG